MAEIENKKKIGAVMSNKELSIVEPLIREIKKGEIRSWEVENM